MLGRGRISSVALGCTILVTAISITSTAEAQVCFRGHPKPRCGGFAVLEFTAGTVLNSQTSAYDRFGGNSPVYVSWSAGYLQNLGQRSALGAGFKVAADDDGYRYGPVLRYRAWLGPTWSLDLAPGVLVGGQTNFTQLRFLSVTADVAINWGDRVALSVGVDQLRRAGGNRWETHAGLRFGTWFAPLATLALGIIAGATYN
jgi:hypothetical protein